MSYRLGSTADSWALQHPGCGCTVHCSTPPGLGTAGKSLWGCEQTQDQQAVGETCSHTWFSGKTMLSSLAHGRNTPRTIQTPILPLLLTQLPKYSGIGTTTTCPSAPNICSLGQWILTWFPLHLQAKHPCSRHGTNIMALVALHHRLKQASPYLAGRVGRAPWAAVPSCCSLGHPGPSWQWAPGPGNAGSRPVPSCSGTWLPAGASWRLCDETETPK